MSAEVDLLRRAAALMRERAKAATKGAQWSGGKYWIPDYDPSDPTGQTAMQRLIGGMDESDAEHYSRWHPDMALMVADWLEDVAKDWDENTTIDSPEVGDYMPPAPKATWCDWCDGAIDSEHYSTADQRCDCYRWPRALAVARTYLGEPS